MRQIGDPAGRPSRLRLLVLVVSGPEGRSRGGLRGIERLYCQLLGAEPLVIGFDVAVTDDDDKIRSVLGFLDKVPS